jgi:hypothetical protein
LRQVAPLLAISQARGPRKDTVLIVDGTLVPTRDRSIAASGKNYRYSTNLQVVIDANSRLVVAVGTPVPGNRNSSAERSSRQSVWQRLHEVLLAELNAAAKLDWSRCVVDSSHVRALKGGATRARRRSTRVRPVPSTT